MSGSVRGSGASGGSSGAAGSSGAGFAAIERRVEQADGPPVGRHHPQAPHRFKGRGPLAEVAVHRSGGEAGAGGHWHLVGYGLSELDAKESDDPEVSGWGHELTFRLAGAPGEEPLWAVDLLANLAAYVWTSGHPFAPGHHLDLGGPIRLDSDTALRAAIVVVDPGLGRLRGPFGRVEMLQVVGVTADELELCRSWSTEGLVELLARRDPLLVTDLARRSVLADPAVAAEARRRAGADGSSMTELRVASLVVRRRPRALVVTMGAGASAALGPALRREMVGDGASFVAVGDSTSLRFEVAETATVDRSDPATLVVRVPLEEVAALSGLFDGRVGWGRRPAWPGLRWHVVP